MGNQTSVYVGCILIVGIPFVHLNVLNSNKDASLFIISTTH